MKKIECIIRPLRLEAVKTALGELGITGMTVSDVRGAGRGENSGVLALPPKIKIEVIARDEDVDEVIQTIQLHARTGQPGDGKIFVMPAGNALRIRTGDEGEGVV